MDNKWFNDQSKFELLTKVIRETDGGGVVYQSDLTNSEIEIAESGVEDGLLRVSRPYSCPGCDEVYNISRLPDVCSCGHTFPAKNSVEPNKIKYYTYVFPDRFINKIGRQIEDIEIIYESQRIEDVPVNDLHPAHENGQWFIRISPYYNADMGFYPFPNYRDLFLSWDQIPDLILRQDLVIERIRDVIDNITADSGGSGNFSNPSGHQLSITGVGNYSKAPWFTMRRDHGKEFADARAKKEYGCEYHDLFENLCLECLHLIFPYTKITGTDRGSGEPDGYLRSFDSGGNYTYLIESKCYSKDFKLFGESDKSKRYIDNYLHDVEPRTGEQLKGCIFMANKFNQDRLPTDIADLISRSGQNIDVICLNDLMMSKIVEYLRSLYRKKPSSAIRIYDHTSWYHDLFDIFRIYTERYQANPEHLKYELIDVLEAASEHKTDTEKSIKSHMNRRVGRNGVRSRLDLPT